MVSVRCLYVLGYLYYLAYGQWADPMSYSNLFLLAKPTGGFWTIRLLTSLHRVWARIRVPLASDWATKIPRFRSRLDRASPSKEPNDDCRSLQRRQKKEKSWRVSPS